MADATVDNYISSSLTGNGSTDAVRYLGDGLNFYVYGTFGGGDVTIESSADGSTWIAESDASAKTANFVWRAGAGVARGVIVRATLANASGTTLTVRSFQGTGRAIGK